MTTNPTPPPVARYASENIWRSRLQTIYEACHSWHSSMSSIATMAARLQHEADKEHEEHDRLAAECERLRRALESGQRIVSLVVRLTTELHDSPKSLLSNLNEGLEDMRAFALTPTSQEAEK